MSTPIKEDNYTWDLESILEDYNYDINILFDKWEEKQKEILDLYPNIFSDKNNFIKYIRLSEEYDILNNRLYNYISNNLNENLSNNTFNSWMQKYMNKLNEFSVKTSDFTNRVIKEKNNIRAYLENPKISEYCREFELIFRNEAHLLNDSEEKLLAQLQIPLTGYGDVFSVLTDNDLKFNSVLDAKGNLHKIENFITGYTLLRNSDRVLRKNTLASLSDAFNNIKQTLTKTLYYNYLSFNKLAQIKKFKDYVEATCFDDEIEESLILHIYEQVKKYKSSYEKFYKIRKQILKKILDVKELEPYDMSMEIAEEDDSKFTIKQIQQEVLSALKILGPGYIKVIRKAFKERWISWLPKPGKQTGAYSIGGINGLNKYYISMNFDGTMRSLETVIHELGHSVNSYYINKNQKIYNDEKIFYAEISSITNETLLSYYLIDKYKKRPKNKLFVLDSLIKNFFNTTSRQIVFSEFEYIMNMKVNHNEAFTTESVESTYFDLMTKYLDVNPKDKDLYSNDIYYRFSLLTPYRVSHFYAGNFYVYKYAIGQLGAIINAKRIHDKDDKQLARLYTFLESGTSKSPLETVKLLGIDLSKDAPWQEAQKIVDEWIEEYIKIAKELKYINK